MTKVTDEKHEQHNEIMLTQYERIAMSHLRSLAANIMKIAGGTGKPHEIAGQVLDTAAALQTYRELASVGIDPAAFAEALDIDRCYSVRDIQDPLTKLKVEAEKQTVCGSLGVAAWHLAGQPNGRTTHEKMERGCELMAEFRAKVSR